MRIGFFTETYTPQVNGAVTSINLFADELTKKNHEVEIFAPAPGEPERNGIKIHRLSSITFFPYPEFRAALPTREIYKLVENGNFDIVHTHGPFAIGYQGWKAAKKFGIPYFTTFHTPIADYVPYLLGGKNSPLVPYGKSIAWAYTRWYYNRFPLVFSPSNAVADQLKGRGIKSNIKLLRTGVKLGEFDKIRKSKKVLGDYDLENPYMIHSGRLSYEKNVDTIIRAYTHIYERYDVDLVITSRGPLFDKLKKLADDLGVSDRVHFTGYIPREDQVQLFKNAMFGIIASDAETQGLVILEEMACGMSLIGSNYLAVPESVIPGETGQLFRLYDDVDLSKKMKWMIEHDADRKIMAKNARRFAEENTAEKWTDKLIEYYEENIRG